MNKALVKFNNGNGAILCSECKVIIRTGKDFSKEDWSFARGEGTLAPQYCNKHTKH